MELNDNSNEQNKKENSNSQKPKIISEEKLTQLHEKLTREIKEEKTVISDGPSNSYERYLQQIVPHQDARELLNNRTTNNIAKPQFEKHHILPRFEGGTNSSDNLLLLTSEEHTIAHGLRWKALNKQQDKLAFFFRNGQVDEVRKIQLENIKKNVQRDKELGRNFFSKEFQSEMGKRGGSKGGSANTQKQFEARQKVGLTYGPMPKNQSDTMKNFLDKYSVWGHSKIARDRGKLKKNEDRGPEVFCLISPKKTFTQVQDALEKIVPNQIIPGSRASMNRIVTGEKQNSFGWRLIGTFIRSEVAEGIEDFYNLFPNEILRFEEDLLENEGLE